MAPLCNFTSMNRVSSLMKISCKVCQGHRAYSDCPTLYDQRKFSHDLPLNVVCPPFEPLPCVPTGVFRVTTGELLGKGAGKECMYKNPEYFSYQHMSYYDMHMLLRYCRLLSPESGRKP